MHSLPGLVELQPLGMAMKTFLAVFFLTSALTFAQQNSPSAQSPDANDMKGMNMPGHDMSQMGSQGQSAESSDETNTHVMHSMEGHHIDMVPHMKMTDLRPAQPGDAERAQKVVVAARAVMDKYKDYHAALNDGFHIFHPEVAQKQYHFTNYRNAFAAAVKFDPDQPTSLLYEKEGDNYRLVGVMYTAPKRFTEDDLNQRIPLSVAQWHEHVNFCAPPTGHKEDVLGPNPKFGLRGSITEKTACDSAGGTFHPVIFNWMVHVYPLEKAEAQIWSTDRQHQHED
jgi:hypothetical protein